MKAVLILPAILAGCRQTKPAEDAKQPTFHVVAAHPDERIDVEGTFGNALYALSVDREQQPPSVAYYEPIDVPDVGKDLPATMHNGSLIIQTARGRVRYTIESAREK